MVTCRNVQHLHDAFIDGELSAVLTAEVQAHLLQCPECQRQIELVRAAGCVIAADRSEPPLPADFASRVVANLPQRSSAPPSLFLVTRRQRRRILWQRLAAGFVPAAAAVLAVCVLILPPAGRDAAPNAPRLVASEFQYAPVDVLGLREWVDPTLSSFARTERVADDLHGLYRITVNEAATRLPEVPAADEADPQPFATSEALFMELLHPFLNMMAPPPPTAEPADDIVRL